MLIVDYIIVNHNRPLKSVRMISTLVGRSSQDNMAFVLKPVTRSIFEHSRELKKESVEVRQIRHRVDEDKENRVLIYDYATSNVLEMINDCPPLPLQARKAILKELGLALKDMHARNWIHLDVKPDNVFIDWFVQLGDLDCALYLTGTHLLNHEIGKVMWQSPEGQLGRAMGKHSEVLSLGLLASQIRSLQSPSFQLYGSFQCLFVLTGVELFHLDFDSLSVELERVILDKLLSNFGPLPNALAKHVDDEKAGELLKDLWKMIEEDEERAEEYEPFGQWTEADYPNLDNDAKRLILRMTHLDPGKRVEMVDIMTDPYWDGVGSMGLLIPKNVLKMMPIKNLTQEKEMT
ncbi:uncharacterized protein EAF02_006781 [Botrytis sinoallii]|uniref:uncharacterized protein n=1 Tax=Botrytis sinoallii TaxID=1463999 RepID=UPI0018FFC01F|nr:uncharacterized protein EAF02_006781 [Botrytis sinoallii]KAF7880890.1 hypothetical protein EAF02_006781 [Botrytis sinoallii]